MYQICSDLWRKSSLHLNFSAPPPPITHEDFSQQATLVQWFPSYVSSRARREMTRPGSCDEGRGGGRGSVGRQAAGPWMAINSTPEAYWRRGILRNVRA